VAAQLAEKIMGKEGKGGGWLDMLMTGASSFFGGAKAEGGDVMANQPYLVGEKGPEMFVPRSAGNIVPNAEVSGARPVNVVINQSFAANTDRRTTDQAALQAQRRMQAALRNA
jgi:SLT domain-containing protein